jgi:hypothetical protein
MADRFRALKTGPLELALDGADLRYVRFAGTEIVRRLYVAVRDEQWATPEAALDTPVVSGFEDRIEVRAAGRFRHDAIALDWTADIDAHANGTLRYRLQAVAKSDFAYNRFGLCLLQPLAGIVGSEGRWKAPDGDGTATLTEQIGRQELIDGLPQPLIGPFSELEIDVAGHGPLRFRFAGDLFELEDQRNWTDASYKTYGPPLALGFPLRATTGQRFEQIIEIEPAWTPTPAPVQSRASITIGHRAGVLPPIGLVVAPDRSEQEHDRIRLFELSPAHLRVDVTPDDLETLIRAEVLAQDTGARLEVALRISEDQPMDGVLAALMALDPPPVRVLLLPSDLGATNPGFEKSLGPLLRSDLPGVPLIGGTASHFVALNNGPFELNSLDGIAYAMEPQVHASDEASIMESLEAQGDTVASARAIADGKPVSVGPIALRNRALGPDPRQASSFCAAWTLGTINALATADAASITLFETAGEGSTGDARGRFPVHAVLAALGRRTGEAVASVEIAEPLALSALALQDEGRTRLLLANSRNAPMPVSIAGLSPGAASLRDPLLPDATESQPELRADGTYEIVLPAGGLLELDHESDPR